VYTKEGSKWTLTNTITDNETIYRGIAAALMSKYRYKSPAVTRIEDYPNYNAYGGRTITVYQDNGVKLVYDVVI
jgi:hypothetical protein